VGEPPPRRWSSPLAVPRVPRGSATPNTPPAARDIPLNLGCGIFVTMNPGVRAIAPPVPLRPPPDGEGGLQKGGCVTPPAPEPGLSRVHPISAPIHCPPQWVNGSLGPPQNGLASLPPATAPPISLPPPRGGRMLICGQQQASPLSSPRVRGAVGAARQPDGAAATGVHDGPRRRPHLRDPPPRPAGPAPPPTSYPPTPTPLLPESCSWQYAAESPT